MQHDTALLATIAVAFALAFVLGFAATGLRLPPLVGYLLAGVAVGPRSPGFVADPGLAGQLAEIGVILLMFGVGLHFSLDDLRTVRRIVLPGAVARIVVATALSAAVVRLWGWSWGEGIVLGLALSVASTVVLLKAFEERGILDTVDGRIAVGWLIVEDFAMVLALVLLPALAVPLGGTTPEAAAGGGGGGAGLGATIALTLGKVAAFLVVMLVVGRRAVPWLLERVARTGSRELFTLSVLAVALGVAMGAAALFGVSLALGAFFAGVVINESDLSHQAAADALPLQDAFAVLFFVSVGMLFDPSIILHEPLRLLAVVLMIVLGKSVVTFLILLLLRQRVRTALTISAGLAQIGEFSFILTALGASLGLLPTEGQSLVLGGALISITLNSLVIAAVRPLDRWFQRRPRLLAAIERAEHGVDDAPGGAGEMALSNHAILVGYGRVGSTVGQALAAHGIPYVVVERDRRLVVSLRERGVPGVSGDASRPGILAAAHPERARLLVVATPDPYQARRVLELAREANPGIDTVVRTHGVAEQTLFERLGVGRAVMGERELAFGMAHYALVSLGQGDDAADETLLAIRRAAVAPPERRAHPRSAPRGAA